MELLNMHTCRTQLESREELSFLALIPCLSVSPGAGILILLLGDAGISEQQFSSQPVLLARSYESVHLNVGNLTPPLRLPNHVSCL